MSRSISYSSAPCEDDEMFEKDTMISNLEIHLPGVGEAEDGDAGSPSNFHNQAAVVSRPNTLTPITTTTTTSTVPATSSVTSHSAPTKNGTLVAPQPSPSAYVANSFRHSSSAPLKISSPTSPLDSFRTWSSSAIVYARQYVGEHLGRRGRSTTDPDVTSRVSAVLDQQRQYACLLRLVTTLTAQTEQVVRTQRALSDALGELSQSGGNVALGEQFSCSADTLKIVSKNGDSLLASLNVFKQSLTTLCNTTIEDTLATVKKCDRARIKYDAYRLRIEDLKTSMGATRDAATGAKLRDAESAFQTHKQKYDRIHGDLIIKLKFLEENKAMVCQKHLFLLHKAFMCYVSGNQQGVDEILKRCNIDPLAPLQTAAVIKDLETALSVSS